MLYEQVIARLLSYQRHDEDTHNGRKNGLHLLRTGANFFVYIVYYISHYFYTAKQITKLLHGLVDLASAREMQNAAKTISG